MGIRSFCPEVAFNLKPPTKNSAPIESHVEFLPPPRGWDCCSSNRQNCCSFIPARRPITCSEPAPLPRPRIRLFRPNQRRRLETLSRQEVGAHGQPSAARPHALDHLKHTLLKRLFSREVNFNLRIRVESLPKAVGYHCFEWYDEPKEGRFDGENSNYGLVNIKDQLYTQFVAAVKAANHKALSIHRKLMK